MRRFVPQLFAQIFCISLLLLLAPNSNAQLPIRPSIGRPDIQSREWELGHLRPEVKAQYDRQQQARVARREDFRKLQIVNNALMQRMFLASKNNTPKLTPKEISSSLEEIKKVAQRLRTNLPIPRLETDKDLTSEAVTLSPGLLRLDKAVMSFVENPLFSQPRVYDSEMATKAGKDLNEIVRLSEFLRKLSKVKHD
ncbi:MAG TPA: hypothetical protein VFH91_05110 [Pyrinomonadaceae bacterium]|nr:hypothetical protein [Pyrinomonadaceae bacterium]